MTISITVTGAESLSKKLARYPKVLDNELDRTVANFGDRLLQACKRHASGRPGPNIVTGQYVGRMQLLLKLGSEHREASVSNDSPQAHRLEYGFYGTDSRGRVYHQGPFPHMRPAFEETVAEFKPIFQAIPSKAWDAS